MGKKYRTAEKKLKVTLKETGAGFARQKVERKEIDENARELMRTRADVGWTGSDIRAQTGTHSVKKSALFWHACVNICK